MELTQYWVSYNKCLAELILQLGQTIIVTRFRIESGFAQSKFNGLDMNMSNHSRLSDAKTRSISPENFTGEKGKGANGDPVSDKGKRNVANAANEARDLGKGWKVNPFIIINSGETFTIAEMEGPGAIQHIWMTPTGNWRFSIIRIYWDDEKTQAEIDMALAVLEK